MLREVFGTAASFAADARGLGEALLRDAGQADVERTAVGRALAARHTWDHAAAAHRRLYDALG